MSEPPQRLAQLALFLVVLPIGACGRYADRSDPASPDIIPTDHSHAAAASSGMVAAVGRDQYHAEAVFGASGVLTLYILGQDATRVQEVRQQVLTAYLKANDGSDALVTVLRPDPLPEDSPGRTSRFTGELPSRVVGKPLSVTVAGLEIEGERFTVRFQASGS